MSRSKAYEGYWEAKTACGSSIGGDADELRGKNGWIDMATAEKKRGKKNVRLTVRVKVESVECWLVRRTS